MANFGHIFIIGNGVMGKLLKKRIENFYFTLPHQRVTVYDKGDELKLNEDKQTATLPTLVIVATPISEIQPVLKKIAELNPENTYVNEIGSVKGMLKKYVEIFRGRNPNFCSIHPMVGPLADWESESWNAKCLFVMDTAPLPQAVRGLWEGLGFEFKSIDYQDHDVVIGKLSHLIHFTIIKFVAYVESTTSAYERELAGSSWYKFKEMAEGAKRLSDIYETNTSLPGLVKEFSRFLEK